MADNAANPEAGLRGDERIIAEAKRRFKATLARLSTTRKLFLDDLKFDAADSDNGYQWPGQLLNTRTGEDQPCLTINKTHQHNLQIINDGKQNKPGVKVIATGNGASAQSAQVFGDIIRRVEYISDAQSAYDTAYSFSVRGGFGWWRILPEYCHDGTFDQDLYIRRVKDPLSVLKDLDVSEADGSDAMFGFVYEDRPTEEVAVEYPKIKDNVGAQNEITGDTGSWVNKDHTRVAEYYRKVRKKDKLVLFTEPDLNDDGSQNENAGKQLMVKASEMPKRILRMAIDEHPDVKTREITTDRVEWFKIVGDEIVDRRTIDKGTELPIPYIPLIQCVGEETIIEGKIDWKSHTRQLKDPQRMLNYNAPLALDTPLPTPSGWTTMGKVKAGDILLDENGKPVEVAGTSPVFLHRKCYRVEFDDGSHIIADDGHRWTVEERAGRKTAGFVWENKTLPTDQLTPKKHFIYVTKPLELEDAQLPIHPYVLGVWLGDGRSDGSTITSALSDVEEMRANISACGHEVSEPRVYSSKTAADINVYGIRPALRELGVFGNKHIPASYLRGSYKQRLALLQGLMDTDGCATKGGQCVFTNVSDKIANGFAELLRSLGLKATFAKIKGAARMFPGGYTSECQDCYRFAFSADPDMPVFGFRRKFDRQAIARTIQPRRTKRHRIVSVTSVPSVPVKCVGINSASHLFLAGEGMIPTHNSAFTQFGALQSKTPYIMPARAYEGYETYWNTANRVNHSVLAYNDLDPDNPTIPIAPPKRQDPPAPAPVFSQGMLDAEKHMMLASGQFQPPMDQKEMSKTPRAINERSRHGDNATYHFIDSLAIALRLTGKILIAWIPHIYDTERVIKIRAEDGSEREIKIDPKAQQALLEKKDQQKKVVESIFNPTVGKYDVEADVGPGYATKRQEAFNAFSQIAVANPDALNVFGDYLFKSMDVPFAEEIGERYKRKIPPEILGEGPPPEVVALRAQLENVKGLLTDFATRLAEKDTELKGVRAGKAVEAYNAETKRVVDIAKLTGSADQLVPVITQAVMQALTQQWPPETQEPEASPIDTGMPGNDDLPPLSDLPWDERAQTDRILSNGNPNG